MILNRPCSFYVHDNFDSKFPKSIPCTIWPLNEPLDLASELISYHMVGFSSNFQRKNKVNEQKRIRNENDKVVFKSKSDLQTVDDFKLYYESKKAVVPLIEPNEKTDVDEDDRKFEVFDHPSTLKSPPSEIKKAILTMEKKIECTPHPMIDCIIKHFGLLKPKYQQTTFYCQPLYVMDPITILVVPINTVPTVIDLATEPKRNPLLPGLERILHS